jgi:hypothetical protein
VTGIARRNLYFQFLEIIEMPNNALVRHEDSKKKYITDFIENLKEELAG